jgi:hypothetical protein
MYPTLRRLYETHKLTLNTLPTFKEEVKKELKEFLRRFKDVSLEDKIIVYWG